MSSPTHTSRQERLLAEIMCFMPDIKYVKGTDTVVADALSRRVDLASLVLTTLLPSALLLEIQTACTEDPESLRLLSQGTLVNREALLYTVEIDKLFVPESLRDKVLSECHTTPFSGHLGFKKTYEQVCRYFWWSAISTTVRHFCKRGLPAHQEWQFTALWFAAAPTYPYLALGII